MAALLPVLALMLGAGPAGAYPAFPGQLFFGEDDEGDCSDPFPPYCDISDSTGAEAEFLGAVALAGLVPLLEDFESFDSGEHGELDLLFEHSTDPISLAATLLDPSDEQYGYIGTQPHEDRGFPITGTPFWKNRAYPDEGLFTVDFHEPVRAFGFYATAYGTTQSDEGPDTRLVLKILLDGGGTVFIPIDHEMAGQSGNVFYLGVLSNDPFVRATLLNLSDVYGDVIGFDDFTAALVPEPGTGLLVAAGLAALAAARRSRPLA